MFERILLVLDGSSAAERAIPYAEWLTKAFDSRLFMLFLKRGPDLQHDDYAEVKANEIASRMGQAKLKIAHVHGEWPTGIINYVEQNGIGLVIMATHSRSGILLWPMGRIASNVLEDYVQEDEKLREALPASDTAAKVVQGINVPVLSIKVTGTVHEPSLKRIVAPLDGSQTGQAALPYAAALAKRLQSELILLQVVAPVEGGHSFGLLGPGRPSEPTEKLMSEARSYLFGVCESLSGVKRIRIEVRAGETPRDITRFAKEVGADLVALSTHGKTSAKGTRGSVFRYVMQAGRTHILSVRS